MKAFGILFVLYISTFVTGHEVPQIPNGVELAEDLLKSMTSAEELLDLICSCRESAKTEESKLPSVDVTPRPVDCLDVKELGYTTSGRYNIYPSSRGTSDVPVEVWCDMDDAEGGWMVIQRRDDGSVNFNGSWHDYKGGFGYAGGEFWIGNENLNHITNQKSYELRVEVELWNGSQIVRSFEHFRLGNEASKYKLVINSGIPQDGASCTSPGPLGMEDGQIRDGQISASSIASSAHAVANSRLNSAVAGTCWASVSNDVNQWIQVAFGSPHYMTGVITQGRQDYAQWVTKFKVQHSYDGNSWTNIKDGNDQDAVFAGNSDKNTPVTNLFNASVTATFIRIRPTEWNNHISLRFEVLGCFYEYKTWTNLNYQTFSTKDTDNDGVDGSNCATIGGAWWYGDVCVQASLNGEYMKGPGTDNKGIIWEDTDNTYRVKRSEMKIRPVNV